MNEIIFVIEEAAEGGFTARALGESIFTEADSLHALRQAPLATEQLLLPVSCSNHIVEIPPPQL